MPPESPEMPPAWTVYFGVASADDTTAKATALGAGVLSPPMDIGGFGRIAILGDPTGAVFGLWQSGSHKGVSVVGEPGAYAWSEVNTRDAAAAASFYTSLFGLRDEVVEMQGTPYHMLHAGDGPACGVLQMTAEWGDMPPHWMTYFGVADADAAKAAVLANGGQVPFGPFDSPYGRIIVAMDPQGAAVSFIETKPPSAN
jgi:predicted enzyme related to lactoylglutathione lyase